MMSLFEGKMLAFQASDQAHEQHFLPAVISTITADDRVNERWHVGGHFKDGRKFEGIYNIRFRTGVIEVEA